MKHISFMSSNVSLQLVSFLSFSFFFLTSFYFISRICWWFHLIATCESFSRFLKKKNNNKILLGGNVAQYFSVTVTLFGAESFTRNCLWIIVILNVKLSLFFGILSILSFLAFWLCKQNFTCYWYKYHYISEIFSCFNSGFHYFREI